MLDDEELRNLYSGAKLVDYIYNEFNKKEEIEEEEVSYVKETSVKITYDMVNIAISLFEPHLPHEFMKRNSVYMRKPVRAVVKKVLENVSIADLNTMIQQYFVDRRDDQFRPSVGTIYEFCTTKFVKIQDFLRPKSGGARYSLANIPGEKRGEFNDKHKEKMDKLREDRDRVNREFQESTKDKTIL